MQRDKKDKNNNTDLIGNNVNENRVEESGGPWRKIPEKENS